MRYEDGVQVGCTSRGCRQDIWETDLCRRHFELREQSRRDREAAEETRPYFKATEWSGLEPGDLVKVIGEAGEFKFINVDIWRATGVVTAVNLYGGRGKGLRQIRMHRSIRPERVRIPSDRELKRQRRLRAEREAAESREDQLTTQEKVTQ